MPGQNFQKEALFRFSQSPSKAQTSNKQDTELTAFPKYLHFKNMHKAPSNNNLVSELPGNRALVQQVAQQICTTPD